MKLTLCTWNATGIISSSSYLCNLLKDKSVDICGVSEHFLYPSNVHFLSTLNSDYNYHVACDKDLSLPGPRRVGKGGIFLMWHKKLDNYIVPLNIDDDRIIGIQLQTSPGQFIFIFQLYLPCVNSPIRNYRQYIDSLYDLWNMYSESGTVLFLGDYNAQIDTSSNRTRDVLLCKFLTDTNLIPVNTLPSCKGAKFSYVSYDNEFHTLIDFICVPVEFLDCVRTCEIIDDNCLNVSRHRPVLANLLILSNNIHGETIENDTGINWRKCTQRNVDNYINLLKADSDIKNLVTSTDCNMNSINTAYDLLSDRLVKYAAECFPKKKYVKFLKPYWNSELTAASKYMKHVRWLWCCAGRPRDTNDPSYIQYKSAKCDFRRLHRKCVINFLQSLNEDIDRCAEIDSNRFWKLVNSRRRQGTPKRGAGINFNGNLIRDRDQVTDNWCNYFQNLYTPTYDAKYDQRWNDHVVREVTSSIQSMTQDQSVIVLPEVVNNVIDKTPHGKASGYDNLQYEHLIYAKEFLSTVLANIYTRMLRTGHVPAKLNRGVIITLHKGGNKRKDCPDNYRAITLTSVILKVYESVLLHRSKDTLLSSINHQQGGFQDGLSCLMTSFILRENIHFAHENNSKLYASFMDGRKAFDVVWHQGLLFKLINDTNIDTTTLLAIKGLYSNMTSCVNYMGQISNWFPVQQGTRQGGITSPLLYLIFINGLICELEQSGFGVCMYNIAMACPTVADDMVLLSYSINGINSMLAICNRYANRWRYKYNADKCTVIVFNETLCNMNLNTIFSLGDERIAKKYSYVHLGITSSSDLSSRKNIDEACTKLRGSLLGINGGLSLKALNPLSSRTMYSSVVIPKALYGCELWSMISATDIEHLERSHRFCAKYIQSLPSHVSTDIVLCSLDMPCIECIIDQRKLLFLGQLCRLSNLYLAKQVFNNRLVRFINYDNQYNGFVPDIYRILQKYNLCYVLLSYIDSGLFPSKSIWKAMIRQHVIQPDKTARYGLLANRMNSLVVGNMFHSSLPNKLWILSRIQSKTLTLCKKLFNVISLFYSSKYIRCCERCSFLTDDIIIHRLCYCPTNNSMRNVINENIIYTKGLAFYLDTMFECPRRRCETLFSLATDIKQNRFAYFKVTKLICEMCIIPF